MISIQKERKIIIGQLIQRSWYMTKESKPKMRRQQILFFFQKIKYLSVEDIIITDKDEDTLKLVHISEINITDCHN